MMQIVSGELGSRLLYYMKLMRALEHRIEKLYRQGKIVGGVFFGRGQEAISAGSAILTEPADVVCPSHRDLAAFLIRGMEPWVIVAHYLGRRDGPTRGRDGNTHMGSLKHHIISYISSMAAIVPVANGVAFSFQYRKQPNVVLCYFGDGATSRGEWHEAMNFGAVFNLPIVYICNNNQYAYSTPVSRQMAVPHITDRAAGYGFPCHRVDGNDVLAVHEATKEAMARARRGEGPTLLECETFRMSGHSAHDGAEYVPKELFEQWARKCPIVHFEKVLLEASVLSRAEIEQIDQRVAADVEEAVRRAELSPYPDPAELLLNVFADGSETQSPVAMPKAEGN
ncbi:MAG: thiamine pyrophosphate-dependent dehydrogenase E1 component subunit alpha [Acidobacteriia bacterium]|nr:thiamine pyrophosphate-dependent dehydrogenase E1 component subunit alpha [Terriglobia bacterium]